MTVTPEMIEAGAHVIKVARYAVREFAPRALAQQVYDAMEVLDPEVTELRERLRGLSFSLAMGGSEETDLMKLLSYVEEGIDTIQQVEAKRTADLIEELSKKPKTTWGQVRTAVLERAGLSHAPRDEWPEQAVRIAEALEHVVTEMRGDSLWCKLCSRDIGADGTLHGPHCVLSQTQSQAQGEGQ